MRSSRCRWRLVSLMLWSVMGFAFSSNTTTPDSVAPSPTESTSLSQTKSSPSLSSFRSLLPGTSEILLPAESIISSIDLSLNSPGLPPPTSEDPSSTATTLRSASQPEVLPSSASSSFTASQPPSPSASQSSSAPQAQTTATSLSLPSISSLEEFYNLTKEFFQWKIQDFPQLASQIGIIDGIVGHLDKLNPGNFEQRKLRSEDFLQRAQQIITGAFSEVDLLNYKIFIEEISTYLRNFKYLKYLTPITAIGGPQLNLKQLLKNFNVPKSLKDFETLLSRYGEFPRQAEDILNIMKGNLVDGLMPSNWSLAGVIEQFDSLLVPFSESAFFEPFLNLNLNITTQQKDTLKQQAQLFVQDLLSSLKMIRDFVQTEYFPAARPIEGVSSLLGGLDFYKASLNFHTTTNMTPQQIHDLGLSEVTRIQREVAQTAVQLGLANKTLAEIVMAVQADPSQKFNSKEDLLNTYRNAVHNVIYPLMDRIVNGLPIVNVSVEENISGDGFAKYSNPSMDGSRPGTFFINSKNLQHHRRYEVNALTLHESVPGHHLQAVNLFMNPSIPDFRKFTDFDLPEGDILGHFPMYSVFTEGWGLYSEYLGHELGLYEDPYQRLGHHSSELSRASGLVVDTGLHAFGWTRQQAINYLLENTAMTEGAIQSQINRYITWPGQACASKVGEIKIKELRQRAETELGYIFSLQDFHEMVLGCVGPLNILEECVNNFITKAITRDINPSTEPMMYY